MRLNHVVCVVATLWFTHTAKAQPSIYIGPSSFYADQTYTTDALLGDEESFCDCKEPYGTTSTTVGNYGLDLIVKNLFGGSSSMIGFLSFTTINPDIRWALPADTLPSMDANGNLVTSIAEHRFISRPRYISLTAGVGSRLGPFEFIPLVRFNVVTDASTTNGLYLVKPENSVFHEGSGEEIVENGRGVLFDNIPRDQHRSVRVDLGASVGLSYTRTILGISLMAALRGYALAGTGSLHNSYATTLDIEYGVQAFLGVGL
jgi:hypothetical protein